MFTVFCRPCGLLTLWDLCPLWVSGYIPSEFESIIKYWNIIVIKIYSTISVCENGFKNYKNSFLTTLDECKKKKISIKNLPKIKIPVWKG